jgi:hypothetical protein
MVVAMLDWLLEALRCAFSDMTLVLMLIVMKSLLLSF